MEQDKSVQLLMKVAQSVKSKYFQSATPTELYTSLRSSFINLDSVASELDYNMENVSLDSLSMMIEQVANKPSNSKAN